GDSDSRGAAGLPRLLLLLSQSDLPRIPAGPARVRGKRGRRPQVSRRDGVSIHPTECAPLFFLHRSDIRGVPPVRHNRGVRFRWQIRDRRRHAGDVGKHRPTDDVYVFLPLVAPSDRRQARLFFLLCGRRAAPHRMARGYETERAPHVLGMGEHDLRGPDRSLHPSGGQRRAEGHPTAVTANSKYETHEHDVLIVGAGGAGLRAAIEALAQGAKVALVCKSLLGKAHTVMAEGGLAAAMANVDKADDWRTHFRDTMRGGKFLNNWRMAQLHAQEAPDRVRELEQWGAIFDRTDAGDILQRAFGGHTFKRLCHVGDRTGLEMIRTLQDRGVQLG